MAAAATARASAAACIAARRRSRSSSLRATVARHAPGCLLACDIVAGWLVGYIQCHTHRRHMGSYHDRFEGCESFLVQCSVGVRPLGVGREHGRQRRDMSAQALVSLQPWAVHTELSIHFGISTPRVVATSRKGLEADCGTHTTLKPSPTYRDVRVYVPTAKPFRELPTWV